MLAALSSVARINCSWCCRLLACSSLLFDSCSVSCIFTFLRRFFLLVSGPFFHPDISHFQRWSIYWSVQVLFSFDGQVSYALDHRVVGGEYLACNRPLLFLVECANS